MAGSTYSTNLKIELMTTGENSGTWGDITNTNLGTALEQAVIGYGNPDYTSDANLTISITNSNASQAARCLVLNVTSAFGSLTATRELIVPTTQKQYIVQNNTTGGQSITVKTSAGTGITVPTGRKAHLYVDGTNVIQMFDFVDINGGAIDGTPIGAASASTGSFTTMSLSTALPVLSGGTGVTTSTGTGSVVLNTSPTLVTPALGTPSALVGTNITGTAAGLTAGNVTTNANLTGAVTSVGNATSLGSFTSLQLLGALTDETGTGANVFATSPTLVTPALGTPTALVGTNITGTAAGLTAGNVTTNANLTGAVTSVGNATSLGSFTSLQLLTALTDETGTGANVFATSPTLVTPALGAATATSLVSSGTAASSFTVTSGSAVPLTITNVGTGNSFVVEDSANPDASPVVIDTNGSLFVGSTNGYGLFNAAVPRILSVATDQSAALGANNWGTNTGAGGTIQLLKSISGTIGTRGVVTNGTTLGMFRAAGDDGTAFIEAGQILVQVDGTPGTNDMPGRLIFSTTADGASTPTERMRIDSAGSVGIGQGAGGAGIALDITKLQTGAVSAYTVNVRLNPAVDVTSNSTGFQTFAINGVGTSTTNFFHYTANQGTFAGTAPTNQYGFNSNSSITGATNNYGFYSNIAAAANRWNFYANGTARNYMAADLTVNGATAIPAGGTAGAGLMVSTTANFGVFFGSGAPTLSAAKGSLYLRSDGTTVNDRMYVNTNGSTTWTSVVTSA